MLHLLHERGRLWPPQQALDVAQAGAEADAADEHAAAKALWALGELVRVLGTLAVERAPLARAAAHVARDRTRPRALHALGISLTAAACKTKVEGLQHSKQACEQTGRRSAGAVRGGVARASQWLPGW